ncbi:MAG TPA: ribosomal protein S18-alanine N-acetyltransferase [Spirochaetota bacterium]|nr:ribosomal protein S18-alanine N-acetyltransferase [Spirochaetota bacterium]HOD16455.1 ribosomal protein S18-alanine N-acetyltransferase [Spirochaetota bacterium]HPG50220.1 ribosomal protein S18-alanine N-acetyltransferase [Spirochaetota bacterium]HPN11276.1 ribosomal protein S18-alanine N-acetyltransferase [Spirochaetota bacterium]
MVPVIRKATAGDLDAMHLIEGQGQARWNRRQFEDELRLAFSDVWVLDDGGQVVGFAVTWTVADEIQLNNIGIREDSRRRGLGAVLMDHIIAAARRGGSARAVFLEVSEQNERARLFYRSCGFIERGRRKRYYDGIDAILMERELG